MTLPPSLEHEIAAFPPGARVHLEGLVDRQGALRAPAVEALLEATGFDLGELALALLPVATVFARAPVSGYRVGAVLACESDEAATPDLFLGANVELEGTVLAQSVHAEQSAVVGAWLAGAGRPTLLATSAPPCGYCRQFLRELQAADSLRILVAGAVGDAALSGVPLASLLPASFGPGDLGVEAGLLARNPQPARLAISDADPSDRLLAHALEAARWSYAPYTGVHAGCALLGASGRVYTGRYAENAAHNPSLSPLQCAIARVGFVTPSGDAHLVRAVLVERPGRVTQRHASEEVLRILAPSVRLEYFRAAEA